jgi:hypothetical protein
MMYMYRPESAQRRSFLFFIEHVRMNLAFYTLPFYNAVFRVITNGDHV